MSAPKSVVRAPTPVSTLSTDFDNHADLRGTYYRLRSRYSGSPGTTELLPGGAS